MPTTVATELGTQAIVQAIPGTAYATALLDGKETDKWLIYREDTMKAVLVLPKHVEAMRDEAYAPRVGIVNFVCTQCGALRDGRWGCRCKAVTRVELLLKTPEQFLAWWLCHDDHGDSPMKRLVSTANTTGNTWEKLSGMAYQLLQYEAMGRLMLPVESGQGLDRIARGNNLSIEEVGKVRIHLPIDPDLQEEGSHTMEAFVRTVEAYIKEVANAMDCALGATSSSKPSQVLWRKGKKSSLPRIIELCTPGAKHHLHRTRFTPACSALAQAVNLQRSELPFVRVAGNQKGYPAGVNLNTVFVYGKDETALDMVEVRQDVAETWTWVNTHTIKLPPKTQVLVESGDVITGNTILARGRDKEYRFHLVEFTRGLHVVEVHGSVVEGITRERVTITVKTQLLGGEATKTTDRHSMKGLVTLMKDDWYAEVCINGENTLVQVDAFANAERIGPPKGKCTSVLVEAQASQKALAEGKKHTSVPVGAKLTEHPMALAVSLFRKNQTTGEMEVVPGMELGIFSKHFWLIQPQTPEMLTGIPPVEDNNEVFGEEGSWDIGQFGARIWRPAMEGHLQGRNQEIHNYLLGGVADEAAQDFGHHLLRTLLLKDQPIRMIQENTRREDEASLDLERLVDDVSAGDASTKQNHTERLMEVVKIDEVDEVAEREQLAALSM
jgi:hypothetical protein